MVTSDISPRVISSAIKLKFQYVGVRPCCSKLALAFGHLWNWVGYLAAQTQILSNYTIILVSALLSFYNLIFYHDTFL